MINGKSITGIVLVAGNSTRYGKNRNKNFELVAGKSILSYTINAFNNNKYIDNIIIATKSSEKDDVIRIIEHETIFKDVRIIIGGNSRRESVYNCIIATDSDIVLIHDGARPCIKQNYINECLYSMSKYSGVTIGVKSKDTIKIVNKDNIIISTTKRANTWITQTPQCFDRKILLRMHEKFIESDVTDDCELLEKGGYEVKIIEGDYTNIKITTFEDLAIMSSILK